MRSILISLSVVLSLIACTRSAPPSSEKTPGPAPLASDRAPLVVKEPPLSFLRPAAPRIVALGDLHGDLYATRKALRLAGAIGKDDHWTGGKLTVVQTGDVIDRGDDDRAVLELLQRLRGEAARAGGALITLSGNHEIMNVANDLRYVTGPSFESFGGPAGRQSAFRPGGRFARVLAHWPVVVQLGDSVFVHGGILREHVAYGLDRINNEVSAWMLGERADQPPIMLSESAPVWTRLYSSEPDDAACAQLEEVLSALSARRMVVGHTPQQGGISSACGGKVWRIDVGMSRFYGGSVQVLQLDGENVRPRTDAN